MLEKLRLNLCLEIGITCAKKLRLIDQRRSKSESISIKHLGPISRVFKPDRLKTCLFIGEIPTTQLLSSFILVFNCFIKGDVTMVENTSEGTPVPEKPISPPNRSAHLLKIGNQWTKRWSGQESLEYVGARFSSIAYIVNCFRSWGDPRYLYPVYPARQQIETVNQRFNKPWEPGNCRGSTGQPKIAGSRAPVATVFFIARSE